MDEHTCSQFKRAKALSRSGQSLEAAQLYREIADSLLPETSCIAFYLLASEELIQAGKMEDAISSCHKAISLDPRSAYAWRSLGSLLLLEKSNAGAEDALRMSLSIRPTATACLYLGVLYLTQNRLAEAEELCLEALRLSPSFDEALYNLGRILKKQCRWDEALEAFERAVKHSPQYGIAHREIASLNFELQNLTKAKHHVCIALELDPSDIEARDLLTRIREKLGGGEEQEKGSGLSP